MISIPSQKPFRGMQINRSHPLAKGLVGCWVMNEATGGKVFDLSGNDNNGTITSADWVADGLDFNGSSDYVVSIDTNDVGDYSKDFTVSIMFASTDTGSGSSRGQLVGQAAWLSNGGKPGFRIALDGGQIWIALEDNTNSRAIGLFGSGFNDGNVHTVTVVFKPGSTTTKVFVDSISQGTLDTSNEPDASGNTDYFCIGAVIRNGDTTLQYVDATIYDSYIYNRALSPTEIAWLNREPYAMFQREISPGILYYEVAAGVSPTAVFYGPFVGPLGGPL